MTARIDQLPTHIIQVDGKDVECVSLEAVKALLGNDWTRVPEDNPNKRLTDEKAAHIASRDGMGVCGYVLQDNDGNACVVSNSAVRWLNNAALFNFLHCVTEEPVAHILPADIKKLEQARKQNLGLMMVNAFAAPVRNGDGDSVPLFRGPHV